MCVCWFLDLEMAVAYWNLVLSGRFKFLDLWNRFLLVSVRDGTSRMDWHLNALVTEATCTQPRWDRWAAESTTRGLMQGRRWRVSTGSCVWHGWCVCVYRHLSLPCRNTTNDPSPRIRGTCCWTLETWLQTTCQIMTRRVSVNGQTTSSDRCSNARH